MKQQTILFVVFAAFHLCAPDADAQKITTRLPAEEQIKYFQLPEHFEMELVAGDPLVINPIAMALDEQGWLYVSESHTYRYGPSGSPVKPFSNPIVCLKPKADGKGFERVMTAEGFEEPVMGMTIRDGKLWCSANNYLFLFDLGKDGKASNKKTILTDKHKAWNPFGMFVLEQGPDGMFYLSVGNHNIDIGGPTNRISGRGSSGIVLRMKPDGSDMERLVHGLRVPYSFEYDPFGQLWVLSNGEGNPNRFLRVINGVDYHCYSRGSVDNNWLAGRHPLAPPCFELPSGAHTQLVRYYGAAYPEAYQGNLLLDNWGAHGFNGGNRAVFRYVPDDKGDITTKETFVGCKDPHFRPSYVLLDPDGNLLIADWYGRDDESDKTGRIWRVKYTGKDVPVVKERLDSAEWKKDEFVLQALGSASHLAREKALRLAVERKLIGGLAKEAASAKEAPGAANALWALLRMQNAESLAAIQKGTLHADWKVRRLALNLLRRYAIPGAADAAKSLASDPSPGVRVEAALTRAEPAAIRSALLAALESGAAKDAHLRYEAAWHLAKNADKETFVKLLASEDADVRLAGLIALDVACYEGFESKTWALDSLARRLAEYDGKSDIDHLLTLARLNGDKSVVGALEKLATRNDVAPAVTARSLLVLRAKAGSVSEKVLAAAGKQFLQAVEKGEVKIGSPSDQLLLLELLESEGPSDFAVKQVGNYLNAGGAVKPAAHTLARQFGAKASGLAAGLWPRALNPKTKLEERIETLATLARIEKEPAREKWEKLLEDKDADMAAEAVRWWRTFKDRKEMKDTLVKRTPELVKASENVKGDLAIVLRQIDLGKEASKVEAEPKIDKKSFADETAALLAKLGGKERQTRAMLGRHVFDRAGCVKCHATVMQNTPLAPSLKGIATAQKADYLIESVLHPSKVIKTGYETELVLTKDGRSLIGLVKDEGAMLKIVSADKEIRVAKADIERRSIQKLSIMPEDQEKTISRREFVDLMAYLQTLK